MALVSDTLLMAEFENIVYSLKIKKGWDGCEMDRPSDKIASILLIRF